MIAERLQWVEGLARGGRVTNNVNVIAIVRTTVFIAKANVLEIAWDLGGRTRAACYCTST